MIIPNISSCCDRVGTGLSDEERRKVADHLRPQFLDADAKRTNAPKCYTVTGASKERPDVWIKDPFQSVVLQVNYLCLQPEGTVTLAYHMGGFASCASRIFEPVLCVVICVVEARSRARIADRSKFSSSTVMSVERAKGCCR